MYICEERNQVMRNRIIRFIVFALETKNDDALYAAKMALAAFDNMDFKSCLFWLERFSFYAS